MVHLWTHAVYADRAFQSQSTLLKAGCPQQGTSIGLKQGRVPTPNQHSPQTPLLKTGPPRGKSGATLDLPALG